MTTNNNIDIYKYYKLVFGNIYLNRYIFQFINGTGKRYEDIDLKFMLTNKKKELVIDKIKVGKFKNEEITRFNLELLINMMKEEESEKEIQLLTRFYNSNKQQLSYLVLSMVIFKSLILLKLFYKDYQFNTEQSSIYYRESLISGDIEIISFLHKTVGLSFQDTDFKKNALSWSLTSINRNKVIEYLLNEMNYQIKDIQYNYECIKRLNFQLSKIIIDKIGSGSLYNQIRVFNLSLSELDQPKVLDFIQTLIYVSSNFPADINSGKYFEKIQQLIKYNNNIGGGSSNDTEMIKLELIKLEKQKANKGLSNVNFIQFNLEREVKRIFIFDFLLKDNSKNLDVETFSYFIVKFASQYNEFSKILQCPFQKDWIFFKACFKVIVESADLNLIKFVKDIYGKSLSDINPISVAKVRNNYNFNNYINQIPISQQIEFLSLCLPFNTSKHVVSFGLVLSNIFSKNNQNRLTFENLNIITDIIETYSNNQKLNIPSVLLAKECFGNNQYAANYYYQIKKQHLFSNWDSLNIN